MWDEPDPDMVDLRERFRDESALGEARNASFDLRFQVSDAQQQAAINLLTKAMRRLREGDTDQADRFIGRALTLEVDEMVGAQPAMTVAQQILYELVEEYLQSDEDYEDDWLDVVLDVRESTNPAGREELDIVLAGIRADYELSRDERRRLESVVPHSVNAADLAVERALEPAAAVRDVLRTANELISGGTDGAAT